MKSPLSKLFWRIILPFIMALVIVVISDLAMQRLFRHSLLPALGYRSTLYLNAIFFCVVFSATLYNTLHWGKEAEDFEAELNAEDKPEAEQRR